MAGHRKKLIENQTLILDGDHFFECELRNCRLVYKGLEHVKLEHCRIVGCTWQFEDAALRTVTLLKGLYVSGQPGKEIVQTIFEKA